jgi:hypothetical protein
MQWQPRAGRCPRIGAGAGGNHRASPHAFPVVAAQRLGAAIDQALKQGPAARTVEHHGIGVNEGRAVGHAVRQCVGSQRHPGVGVFLEGCDHRAFVAGRSGVQAVRDKTLFKFPQRGLAEQLLRQRGHGTGIAVQARPVPVPTCLVLAPDDAATYRRLPPQSAASVATRGHHQGQRRRPRGPRSTGHRPARPGAALAAIDVGTVAGLDVGCPGSLPAGTRWRGMRWCRLRPCGCVPAAGCGRNNARCRAPGRRPVVAGRRRC